MPSSRRPAIAYGLALVSGTAATGAASAQPLALQLQRALDAGDMDGVLVRPLSTSHRPRCASTSSTWCLVDGADAGAGRWATRAVRT